MQGAAAKAVAALKDLKEVKTGITGVKSEVRHHAP